MTATRQVRSSDGLELALYEHGPAGAKVIVAVHGYPDNHSVWDGVAAELADRYRVVTYDVRGTGASGKPGRRAAYRMPQLVDDLGAVLDAVSPDSPVHLLAHDWGSIQAWAAVTDEHFATRIASFTSISGPSLDHVATWLRAGRRHPGAAARQLLKSWYVFAFQLPRLPELFVTSPLMDRLLAATSETPRRGTAERINGLQLYRANMLTRLWRPQPRQTSVPVQVLAPRADAFVSVALQTQAPGPFVPRLTTQVIAGGHWVVVDSPQLIARCTADFVEQVS